MKIGEELKGERKRKGFTQFDLAYLLNWSPSKLSKIENGDQDISITELMEVAEALQAEKIACFTIDINREGVRA